eukprot:12673714-Alexandrium_andersonii.AAC.1
MASKGYPGSMTCADPETSRPSGGVASFVNPCSRSTVRHTLGAWRVLKPLEGLPSALLLLGLGSP